MEDRKVLLEVKDLKTYFVGRHETVKAVDGVSFTLYEGDSFGLVGESGCGKSQTLRSILGLLKQPGKIVGGQILFRGQDLVKMSPKQLRKIRGAQIAQIFQEPMTALNPVLPIRKQMYEAFERSGLSKAEREAKSIEMLKLVGIPEPQKRLGEYPHQFSGGMRQRAMIAIALAEHPALLLADEPTTALDVTIQDQILTLIDKLKGEMGMSLIMVTHNLGVIAQMCNRVAVMYAGRIVEMTDTITLFSKPRHPYTKALMSSIPNGTKGQLETISGTPPNLSMEIVGCPFAPRCAYCSEECKKTMPELREIEPGHLSRCHRFDVVSKFEGLIPTEEALHG